MTSRRSINRMLAPALIAAAMALAPRPCEGMGRQVVERGVLQGRVVDAASDGPLAGVDVAVRLVAEGPDGEVVARVSTDTSGVYRVEGLLPGRYHLRVEHVGYATRTLEAVVGRGPQGRVSVALEVAPIALTPLEVDVAGRVTLVDGAGREVSVGRITAARLRQDRTLTTDSRLITMADVEEAATLGEPDIFRTLQRLPGVSTRDDYSAELWTRGADWGETRVYLDGMPLFNPLHGFGLLSGVGTRSVESVLFQPGVRGPDRPEGSAGIVDLRSRSGRTAPDIEGGVDVSLASAQVWAVAPVGDGGGFAFALRRSWADAVASAASSSERDQAPYAFWDLHATGDIPVGADHRITTGVLIERDAIRGEIPDVLHRTAASWGNVLVSAALEGPLGSGSRYRQRVGVTSYDVNVRRIEGGFDSVFSAPDEAPADHAVRYLALAGEIGPWGGDLDGWGAGYDLVRQTVRYTGPETWPYSQTPPELAQVDDSASLVRLGLWGRGRWRPDERLTLDGGLRVSAGGATADGRSDLSPHLLLHLAPREGLAVAAGIARTTQFAQSPVSVGPRLEGFLQTGRRWILADERRAPIRSTIATLGAEIWLGDQWLASLTGYKRRSGGVQVPDPTPGPLVQRSPLVAAQVRARGLDLSLRRLAGRVTGSFAYSVGRAEATVLGRTVPAPTDRTHVVDLTAGTRIGGGAHLALSYTWASGAPYARVLPCTTESCRGVVLDAPFLRRGPSYSSLDLVLDVGRDFGRWSLGGFVQTRNLFGHDNSVTYRDTRLTCEGGGDGSPTCFDGSAARLEDHFVTGIPRLPLIGLRVAF